MYSDGLVEAHNPRGEMFSIPRLLELMVKEMKVTNGSSGGAALIELLETNLEDFTGPGWEQEDDVTLVTLDYLGHGTFNYRQTDGTFFGSTGTLALGISSPSK